MWIALLINYWKPVAVILLIGGVYLYGYNIGYNKSDGVWQHRVEEAKTAAQKLAADKSAEYQEELTKQKTALTKAKRSLANELSTNAALRTCVVSDQFLQTYDAVATGASAR